MEKMNTQTSEAHMQPDKKVFAVSGVGHTEKILEIGPSYQPCFPKKEGWNVEIVDYTGADELKERMKGIPGAEEIEDVDYIASGKYADSIPRRRYYDVIMGSHIIEHMLDFVAFFDDCNELLSDNGKVKLVVPDCRYEFDYFREPSSLKTILDTHIRQLTNPESVHTMGALAEYWFYMTKLRSGGIYIPGIQVCEEKWANEITFAAYPDPYSIVSWEQLRLSTDEKKYFDVHNWTFTPKSFEILIYELNVLGYIDFIIDWISKKPGSFEFFAVLKRGKITEIDRDYLRALFVAHKLEAIENLSPGVMMKLHQGRCYFDPGGGYSEMNSKLLSPPTEGRIKFDSSLPADVQRIRFDPVETYCMVGRVEVNMEGGRVYPVNGIPFYSETREYVLFCTSDPQFEITLPENRENTIHIECDVYSADSSAFWEILNRGMGLRNSI